MVSDTAKGVVFGAVVVYAALLATGLTPPPVDLTDGIEGPSNLLESGTPGEATPDALDPTARNADREGAADPTTAPGGGPFGPEEGLNTTRLERAIHAAVNERRESKGLRRLQYDTELANIARKHSRAMIRDDFFAHEQPDGDTLEDRFRQGDYLCQVPGGREGYQYGAENIAKDYYGVATQSHEALYSEDRLAEAIVAAWMNSPDHRANILQPGTDFQGIGVEAEPAEEGQAVYVTQDFC